MRFLTALVLSFGSSSRHVQADVVLSESMVQISLNSAILASEVYNQEPNVTGFDKYEYFEDEDESDAAILAEKDGYCFLAFRGSLLSVDEWYKEIQEGYDSVCSEASESSCCDVRKGFYRTYSKPSYRTRLEFKMRTCFHHCKDKDECLVLSGHSQGGATAAVAGIMFEAYDPYVITFGEPPSVKSECEFIDAERWFRYVNTADSTETIQGMSYDPVPFIPSAQSMVYGQLIILGNDNEDVAYVGLDSTTEFAPLDGYEQSHAMVGSSDQPGYLDRLETLVENAESYPISAIGFKSHHLCTDNIECASNKCEKETFFSQKQCVDDQCTQNLDCASGRCDSGNCLPKFGSCMECNEDSDCASNSCNLFRCANLEGKMDDNCYCTSDDDCMSERCEGVNPPTCEAKLIGGTFCDEHSDCLSDRCTWWFHCTEESIVGGLSSASAYSLTENMFSVGFMAVLASTLVGLIAYEFASRRRRGGYVAI